MRLSTWIGLAVIVCAPTMAFADRINFEGAAISIDVPQGWSAAADGGTVTLTVGGQDTAISFATVPAGSSRDAVARARGTLAKGIRNLTFSAQQPANVSGMTGVAFGGHGQVGDANFTLLLLALDTPADSDLLVIAMGKDEDFARNKNAISYIFNHLQPNSASAPVPEQPTLRQQAPQAPGSGVTIPAGTGQMYSAEPGTSTDILGLGYELNLVASDANGTPHRPYPAKFSVAEYNAYEADSDTVDNTFELGAYAHFLFVKASAKVKTERHYMVVHAAQINKVAALAIDGRPLDNAPLYASKIYYGWVLYLVIEGDSTTFTADVAAELGELVKKGGKIDTTIANHHLSTHIWHVGLKPKRVDRVPVALSLNDVLDQFEPGADQPIFVEYTPMRNIVVNAIPWEKAVFKPGRYMVSADFELAGKRADGKNWEWDGVAPRTVVGTLYVDGKISLSCTGSDAYVVTRCFDKKVIDVNDKTTIQISVLVQHPARDDMDVGYTQQLNVVASGGVPGVPIQLSTTGQLRTTTLTLTPIQ